MDAGSVVDPLLGLSEFLAGGNPLDSLGSLGDFVDIAHANFIGKGGSGVVLLAYEKCSQKKLAVKVMSLEHACNSQSDVRREVQIMHHLQPHPNLVQLFGVLVCQHQLPCVSFEGPYLCIVMHYVGNAEPLSKIIRRGGSQPALAARIVPQLASALALMHRLGKVHRDVWSENVLVGESGRVVLVDFGSAEDFRVGPDSRAPLNIPYVSPEAAKRSRQHPADDAWSLGLLISEMLTGHFVVERLESPTVPIHHNTGLMNQLLRDVAVHGSTPLGRVCYKLLDMNGARRLSMDGVISALDATKSQWASTSMCQNSQTPTWNLQVNTLQSSSSRCPVLPAQSPSLVPRCISFPSRQTALCTLPPSSEKILLQVAPEREILPQVSRTSLAPPEVCSQECHAGGNGSSSGTNLFALGSSVEYESSSAEDCWIQAIVLAYHPESGLYDLDCKPSVTRSKIRSLDPFPIGALVEYKSADQNLGWVSGRVLAFDVASGLYDLSCKSSASRRRIRWPACATEYEMGLSNVEYLKRYYVDLSREAEQKNYHMEQVQRDEFHEESPRGCHVASLADSGISAYLAGGPPLSTLADVAHGLDESSAEIIDKSPVEALILGCRIWACEDMVVKIVPLGFATDSPVGVRREIQVMNALQPHPNLAKFAGVMVCKRQLHRVCSPGPYLCTAMQGLGTMWRLCEIISQGGSKVGAYTEFIISQIASALASVHQQGFVHRSVSSENVLVNSVGQVLLFGLGTAEQFEVGPEYYAFSNIPYMSPEASNSARQHPGEDCWALGLLISEMLTGRSVTERMGESCVPIHCKPEVLNELLNEVSFSSTSRAGQLCSQLLALDVTQRITMMEVASALCHPDDCQDHLRKSHSSSSTRVPSSVVSSSTSSRTSTPRQVFR